MILYDRDLKVSLLDFGIEIPLSDTRVSKTFETLASHPVIGQRMSRYHMDRIDEVLTREDLRRVHSADYVNRLYSDALEKEIIRTFELIDETGEYYRYNPAAATQPLNELFQRILKKAAGTVQCCRTALEKAFCFHFAGGMHHAREETGSGFCLINDIVIAARKLQAEQRVNRVWVIDVDAHKGDGTAALTHDDPTIHTLSIHMARGWPLDGEMYDGNGELNPSFISSDIDIPIAAGEEHLYTQRLEEGLNRLERDGIPDLVIVVCGADPYELDELPSTEDLKLTLDQMMERDRLIYQFFKSREIPQAYLMAGGYGAHTWQIYAQFLVWVYSSLTDEVG